MSTLIIKFGTHHIHFELVEKRYVEDRKERNKKIDESEMLYMHTQFGVCLLKVAFRNKVLYLVDKYCCYNSCSLKHKPFVAVGRCEKKYNWDHTQYKKDKTVCIPWYCFWKQCKNQYLEIRSDSWHFWASFIFWKDKKCNVERWA